MVLYDNTDTDADVDIVPWSVKCVAQSQLKSAMMYVNVFRKSAL